MKRGIKGLAVFLTAVTGLFAGALAVSYFFFGKTIISLTPTIGINLKSGSLYFLLLTIITWALSTFFNHNKGGI